MAGTGEGPTQRGRKSKKKAKEASTYALWSVLLCIYMPYTVLVGLTKHTTPLLDYCGYSD